MQYLVLRLESYLMSFGEGDYWDVRGTSAFPTKSAILGMLSACAGLDWANPDCAEEIVQIGNEMMFSAREDQKCRIQRDYHTILDTLKADGGLNKNAVQSYRNYLADGSFSVLLAFRTEAIYTKIRKSLMDPVWPIFLGRKACVPTFPVYCGEEIEAGNAKSAFELLEPLPVLRKKKLDIDSDETRQSPSATYACQTEESAESFGKKLPVRDSLINPHLRVFSQREMYRFHVNMKMNKSG